MSDFKPTVDLRPKPEPKPQPAREPKQAVHKPLPPELQPESRQDQQTISRPAIGRRPAPKGFKAWLILLILAVAIGAAYWFVYRPWAATQKVQPAKWYCVKLTNSEEFFGKINNTSADPVVISSVYYDYDLLQKMESGVKTSSGLCGNETSTSTIKLVKRGKELHGPDGTLNVVRSQVLLMEPLIADSKVLKAIENNEKGNK